MIQLKIRFVFLCFLLLLSFWLCEDIFSNVINDCTVQDQRGFGDDQQSSGSGKALGGYQAGVDQKFEAEGGRCQNATDCTDKIQNSRVVDDNEPGKGDINNNALENETVQQEQSWKQHGVSQCCNK